LPEGSEHIKAIYLITLADAAAALHLIYTQVFSELSWIISNLHFRGDPVHAPRHIFLHI
jgi:hypothetical protein